MDIEVTFEEGNCYGYDRSGFAAKVLPGGVCNHLAQSVKEDVPYCGLRSCFDYYRRSTAVESIRCNNRQSRKVHRPLHLRFVVPVPLAESNAFSFVRASAGKTLSRPISEPKSTKSQNQPLRPRDCSRDTNQQAIAQVRSRYCSTTECDS